MVDYQILRLCSRSQQYRKNARSVWVERTGMPCFALPRKLPHNGDDVKRGKALRLVDYDYAVHKTSLTTAFSFSFASSRLPFTEQPAAAECPPPPRRVTVYRLELCSFDRESQCGALSVKCSKGTYIRTIIDDIGAALGTGAVMTALRRTSACGYTLDDCVTLGELKELCSSGKAAEKLRAVESLFTDYEALSVSEAQAKRFKNGGALDILRTALRDKKTPGGTTLRLKTKEGEFLGLGIVSGGLIKILKLFATG